MWAEFIELLISTACGDCKTDGSCREGLLCIRDFRSTSMISMMLQWQHKKFQLFVGSRHILFAPASNIFQHCPSSPNHFCVKTSDLAPERLMSGCPDCTWAYNQLGDSGSSSHETVQELKEEAEQLGLIPSHIKLSWAKCLCYPVLSWCDNICGSCILL